MKRPHGDAEVALIIGVPKEIKDHEYRVSVTPDGVRTLRTYDHLVLVEKSAGLGSGFSDHEYEAAGAELMSSPTELFHRSDMIVKVKEPQLSECPWFRPKQILLTFLHLASSPELTTALLDAGVTAVAYETITAHDGSFPMLRPMSQIAGRLAVQIGARYLERTQGGKGVLLSGVPGVEPGKVVILGGGVVGESAARVAIGMGAQVVVIDRDVERLRFLDDRYPGHVTTAVSTPSQLAEAVKKADLLIGAVLVPGARSPKLLSSHLITTMQPGSVFVDVAVDQGGCSETTRPTTHRDPVYAVHGVLHYCVPNMPGIVPRTSTLALTATTLPFIVRLASMGLEQAAKAEPGLAQGVNVCDGRVTCQGVAEAHGLRFEPLLYQTTHIL